MTRHAVILQHEEHEGPELLASALEAAGFALIPRFRQVNPGDAEADLVVAMGGPMAVYEASTHPFLADEQAVLARRLEAGRPCLGICLGAQLLAAAAGARVFPGQMGFELGAGPVELTFEGKREPVLAGLPASLPVAHWHGDTFEPVPDGSLLASTPRYRQQAFRVGSSFGFQFHPELSAATLRSWMKQLPADVARSGRTLETLLAETTALEQAEVHWRVVLGRLARFFAERASPDR